MSDHDFIPAQVVAKKIRSIQAHAGKLHEALDSRINEVAVESTCLIKTLGESNYGALPPVLFKLETIAETVRQMDATLHGAASTEKMKPSQLETSPQEKPTNLISRVEKLEALLTSTRLNYDGMDNRHSQMLDSIMAQKAQITSQERKMDVLQGTVSSLQEDKAFLEKKMKQMEHKQTARLSDFSQDIIQKVDTKINTFESKGSDVFRQIDNLKSSVEWIDGQMNVLSELGKTVKSELVEQADETKRTLKKRIGKVELEGKQVSQILSTQMGQLDTLRDALHMARTKVGSISDLEKLCKKNEDTIDKVTEQMGQMGRSVQQYRQYQSDIGALKTQMTRLDSQVLRCKQKQESIDTSVEQMALKMRLAGSKKKPRIGFTAQLPARWRYKKGFTLRNMNYVTCNDGECFNKGKGQFTVPQDGLYCFALTLQQAKNDPFTAAILCDTAKDRATNVVTVIIKNEGHYSIVAPANLLEGNVVYVEITEAEKCIELLETTTFSGWLIE